MKQSYVIFIFVGLLTCSCKEVLEVPVPYDGPLLTINGFLRPDSSVTLLINQSRHILDLTPYRSYPHAQIEFFEENESKGFLGHTGGGWYSLNYKPKPNKEYSVKITSKDYGTLEASAKIPERIQISNVVISDNLIQKDTSKSILIKVSLKDPEGVENYYELLLMVNHNDKYYRNDTLIYEQKVVTPLLLQFSGINKISEHLPSSPSVLFSDFMISGSVNVYVPYSQLKDLGQGEHILNVGDDVYKKVKNDSLFLFLNHVDENYYHYRKTLDLQTINNGNPFAEPVTVYTNVKNGFGIFAGFNMSRHIIDLDILSKFSNE